MSTRENARDEWRVAQLTASGNLEAATTSLGIARARLNHAAAEGARYA